MAAAAVELPAPTTTPTATSPVRKRRRKTGTGGAQDDCFACRKRGVGCDRKRPYCTPCIDIGKECSGYKTTLTWGVGVASRGKLRGLACPIANKNVDGSDINPVKEDVNVAKRRKSSVTQPKVEPGTGASQLPLSAHLPATTQPYGSASIPIPVPQTIWHHTGFQDHAASRSTGGSRQMAPPPRLQTIVPPHFDHSPYPLSAASVGSFANEWDSPMDYPQTPGSVVFPDQFPTSMPSYVDNASMSSSADSYQQSLASLDVLQNNSTFENTSAIENSHPELNSFSNIMFDDNFLTGQDQSPPDEALDGNQLSLLNAQFSNPFFYLTPRLQSLMTYYDQHVCPYLVTFDGPSNPYRMHIIQLASQNEGLQNAIAALATNNMRMRKIESRKTGFIEEITEAFDGQDPTRPTAEESCYKQMSIEQLNMQLTDPHAAQDDSVLATLLILCLFHVCDSGFSKFKTQLAGVQKLMSMRSPQTRSNFTAWVEMFFTWFDVMTSTVNDREAQIQGDSIDMLDFSANLGALEQFSGCDGRLFKLIARLGRLNLLSQGREVSSQPKSGETTPRATPMPKRPFRYPRSKRNTGMRSGPRSLIAADYAFIDGNGWGSPIIPEEDANDSMLPEDPTRPAYDERKEFWAEWHDIRIRLQEWQMDVSTLPSPSNSTSTSAPTPDAPANMGPEQRDLVHISESFRHSALLYITRLAHPFLPSSAPEFQALASQALFHITALPVTSCVNKFLLWPLFITGTECVDEGHRNVIRQRCVEIQRESGFFNNISGLEVLERVWGDGCVSGVGGEVEMSARRRDSEGLMGRQAFRWRRAMDRVDGEYIVI
nr:hypothetical protein B0A51_03203 [Rachicladosporium sp. CCFEE 5018]